MHSFKCYIKICTFLGFYRLLHIIKHSIYFMLYMDTHVKIYVDMDKCSKQVFTISNYTQWSGRWSKEGKILKQIPPLSRQNTRQHSTKCIWNRRGHNFKHPQPIPVSMFQRTKSELLTQQRWPIDQGNSVSSENQLRTKIKSFSWQHFI